MTILVTPEAYGCLSLAEQHLKKVKGLYWKRLPSWKKQSKKQKLLGKVQRLTNKAARLLNGRMVEWES